MSISQRRFSLPRRAFLAGLAVFILSGALFSDQITGGPIPVGTNPFGVAVNETTGRVYVANQTSNTVSVIDGPSATVVATIPMAGVPTAVAVDAQRNRVFVTQRDLNRLTVLNALDNSVVTTVTVGSQPQGVCVDTVNNRIYVTNSNNNTCTFITTSDNLTYTGITRPDGSIPLGVAVNASTNRLYVGEFGGSTVKVYDATSGALVSSVSGVGTSISVVAVDSGTNRIYAASYDNSRVGVIDGATNTLIPGSLVPVGTGPLYGMALNATTKKLYVTNSGSNNVTILDVTNVPPVVLQILAVGTTPLGIGMDTVRSRSYVANFDSNNVTVISGQQPNRLPAANAGPDQTVSLSSPTATVTLSGTGSSDPDGDALTYTWTGPFGAVTGATPTVTLALGTHTITLTVSDGKGGTASDTVVITVVDSTPPVISSVTASPDSLWPPNHTLRGVTVSVTATDNYDPAPVCRITGVTSSEPETGPGDQTAPDVQVMGNLTLNLRAERRGSGPGRIYTLTVEARDASGNVSTRPVQVCVPHDQHICPCCSNP